MRVLSLPRLPLLELESLSLDLVPGVLSGGQRAGLQARKHVVVLVLLLRVQPPLKLKPLSLDLALALGGGVEAVPCPLVHESILVLHVLLLPKLAALAFSNREHVCGGLVAVCVGQFQDSSRTSGFPPVT